MRHSQKTITDFELRHSTETEPWDYSARAAEGLRHDWVVAQAKKRLKPTEVLLDVGCSLGQLTEDLVRAGLNVCALDVSPTAVAKTRSRLTAIQLNRSQKIPVVAVGHALSLPFAEAALDMVILCDGLEGWELSPEQKMAALEEVYRVLLPAGTAILTDYLRARRFESYVALVRSGPLQIAEIHYLNDRLWFQINSNFKFLKKFAWWQKFLGHKQMARRLAKISCLFGPAGSRHIGLILRKD